MILYEHVPSLDLHGMDRDYARICINDFISDAVKMKEERVVIIHGKGLGILKKTTQEVLSKNKNVEDFKLDIFNDGQTLVKLKLKC